MTSIRRFTAIVCTGLTVLVGAGCTSAGSGVEVVESDVSSPDETPGTSDLDADANADAEANVEAEAEAEAEAEVNVDVDVEGVEDDTERDSEGDVDVGVEDASPDEEVWTVLGSYDATNVPTRRIYVLVPPGLNDTELVEIVDELRTRANANPTSGQVDFVEHYLMDDDSQIDVLLRELPNTELGDVSNWPEDYVIDATVATSKAFFVPQDDGTVNREYWLCRFDARCNEDDRLAAYDASS